jgi:hypothetical protein
MLGQRLNGTPFASINTDSLSASFPNPDELEKQIGATAVHEAAHLAEFVARGDVMPKCGEDAHDCRFFRTLIFAALRLERSGVPVGNLEDQFTQFGLSSSKVYIGHLLAELDSPEFDRMPLSKIAARRVPRKFLIQFFEDRERAL